MPSQNPSPTAPTHDDRGSFVAIAASPYVAYTVHGAPAQLARLTRNPDGTLTLHPVGEPFARLDLAVDAGRWRAERETYAATTEHTCARCATPITLVDGAWVGTDYTTTGGGLTTCPPDTDNPVGVHAPRQPARSDSGTPPSVNENTTDDSTDEAVHDLFAAHGIEPAAVWTIGALTDTDLPLRLGVTALGSGTVDHAGADTWIYGLWQAQRLHRCGAVHTGAISWTHQQIAVVLAERFIGDDDLDEDTRVRLVAWLNAQPTRPDPA